MARQQRDVPPEGRAVQWRDLGTHQRRIVSDNMRDAGINLPQTAADAAVKFRAAQADPTKSAERRKLAGVKATALENVQPELKSQPVTLQRAANSRERLYNRGIEDRAAANPDDSHQVIPTGAGWYFDHHRQIADSATRHGFPHDWAIAASGVMSPQNSPENERAAVHAIMDANANHKVEVTPEVHQHLAKNGIDVSQHLGQTVHFDQLPVGSVAHLSSGNIRDKVNTTADLHQVARGGTKQNIVKAEKVLAGEIAPQDAVNPHSAPKVWSYVHNTLQAVPNSPTHVEFMGRIHQDAMVRRGHIDAQQQSLDLYGMGEKRGGHLLSPESHTVEDTWQNAASFDQPKTTVGTGRTSVFKAAGSMDATYPVAGVKTRVNEEGTRESAFRHPDVGAAALTHAFNNRATQKAAEQLGRQSGTTLPPAAVQEVGWVQMRKDAGKDPEWNQRKVEKDDPLGGHIRGQGALFDITDRAGQVRSHVPGAGLAPLDRQATHPTYDPAHEEPLNPEADMRKWAAISNNHHKSTWKRRYAGG